MDTMENIIELMEQLQDTLQIEAMYLSDTIAVMRELKYLDGDYMHGFLREIKELRENIDRSASELHEACATCYVRSLMDGCDE